MIYNFIFPHPNKCNSVTQSNCTPHNRSVYSLCISCFSLSIFPGVVSFLEGAGQQRLHTNHVCQRNGGAMACVPLLGKVAHNLSVMYTFQKRVWGGFSSPLSLCRPGRGLSPLSASCVHPLLPREALALAGASVQGSAGARSKPLLRTSAATLIAVLPFLIFTVRQPSAWRFVSSCLNSANIVSKKLTKVTTL